MGCPFGCREAHRKEESKRRSKEYYQSDKGKKKKKALNERRHKQTSSDEGSEDSANDKSCEEQEQSAQDGPDAACNSNTLSYLQMLISLVEGRLVGLDEVLQMLHKIVRQHSMFKRRRFVYTFTYPEQKPP